MEPPARASVPVFRRAASFNHRHDRTLKEVNGRISLNKSQELISSTKAAVDSQKGARPNKRFSTVASRYADPPKKQLTPVADGPPAGHASMTKLPFITGRSVGHHVRKPSSEALRSFQPSPMVAREPIPSATANKVDSLGLKRPRIAAVRASMAEKKSQEQPRAPRFWSLDKGGCSCSKNSLSKAPGNAATLPGSASLLNSATHWLSLVKLAEIERKHAVVVDLFQLAITLKAEPIEEIKTSLQRYQESCPHDLGVIELLQQCEEVQMEASPPGTGASQNAPSKPGSSDLATAVSASRAPVVNSVRKTVIVPVISQNLTPAKKNVPSKPAAVMGRRLSRSSTFSCMDTKSQSAKVTYGKKLVKTLEDLPAQRATGSLARISRPTLSGKIAQVAHLTPTKAKDALQANLVEKTPTSPQTHTDPGGLNQQEDVQPSMEHTTPLADQPVAFTPVLQHSPEQATPTLKMASNLSELAPAVGGALASGAAPLNYSTPVSDLGSTPGSEFPLANGSAEKPVDSISEWLDGETPEAGSLDIQSAPAVDLSPNTVKQMDVDALMKEVVLCIVPEANSTSSPAETKASNVADQASPPDFQVRRKCWGEAGDRPVAEEEDDENVAGSRRQSLSAEATHISVRGSVEKKVKMFSGLAAEVGNANLKGADMDAHGDPKSLQATADENLETPAKPHCKATPDGGAKQGAAAAVLKVYTRQRSLKGGGAPLSTPGAATPCGAVAGAGAQGTGNRKGGAGNGNVTPASGNEDSPSESQGGPPSSGARSRRGSARGHMEAAAARVHLAKPSWKAIVEREMKGSKLRELLAGALPGEASPLVEFVEAQMAESQKKKEPSSAASTAKERGTADSPASSPAKPARMMTRSASKKQARSSAPAPAVEEPACPGSAQKPRKPHEGGTGELESSTAGCLTPGSAVRRSARIQSKVQSRRNMVSKDEFAAP